MGIGIATPPLPSCILINQFAYSTQLLEEHGVGGGDLHFKRSAELSAGQISSKIVWVDRRS